MIDNIKKYIKEKYKKYITCEHTEYDVIKTIMDASGHNYKPKFFEKRKCKICGRIFFSEKYYIINDKKVYVKYL